MDQFQRLNFLKQLSAGSYNEADYQAFIDWTKTCSRDDYQQMLDAWQKIVENQPVFPDAAPELHNRIEAALDQIDEQRQTVSIQGKVQWWKQLAVAASVLFMLSTGTYLYLHRNNRQLAEKNLSVASKPIKPGKNTATLTLSNGKRILLTDKVNGRIADEAGISISKSTNGQIVYTIKTQKGVPVGSNNTIATARGETYQVNLPDGTQVWLNSASSLTYPVYFSGNTREVKLNGEAYFEVAHNAAKPFLVISQGQTVKVLGTHFNVNAYKDEKATETTLLEGSVKVSSNGRYNEVLLSPGQTSVNGGKGLSIQKANLEVVMAWKNGLFIFHNERLSDVFRDIARWYDVEFEYDDAIGRKKLWGTASKYDSITSLLDNLVLTSGIHYKIEGRRITLMK